MLTEKKEQDLGMQVIAEHNSRPSWESNPRVIGRLMRPIHSATFHVVSTLRNSAILASIGPKSRGFQKFEKSKYYDRRWRRGPSRHLQCRLFY
jgi:hypothetical protein